MTPISWAIKALGAVELAYGSTRKGLVRLREWFEYVRAVPCWIEAIRA